MEITTSMIKTLRDKTGAGVMDCRSALIQSDADFEKAEEFLKKKGLAKVASKVERATLQGAIGSYIHPGSRLGVLVEMNCESDFVARTDEFKELLHNITLQVAASNPKYIKPEDVPPGDNTDPKESCLLMQPYIRDQAIIIQDLINAFIAKLGENVVIRRFVRFELGS